MSCRNCSKNGVSFNVIHLQCANVKNVFSSTFYVDSGTTCLTFEEDPEPFGKERDQKIIKICKDLDIEVVQVVSHTLYKLEK